MSYCPLTGQDAVKLPGILEPHFWPKPHGRPPTFLSICRLSTPTPVRREYVCADRKEDQLEQAGIERACLSLQAGICLTKQSFLLLSDAAALPRPFRNTGSVDLTLLSHDSGLD